MDEHDLNRGIENLLTPEQTAKILQMSPKFVRDHAEELGGIRIGGTRKKAGRLRFRLSSLRNYIDRNSPRMEQKHVTPQGKKPARETPPIAKSEVAM
jgi:hypothetical protein